MTSVKTVETPAIEACIDRLADALRSLMRERPDLAEFAHAARLLAIRSDFERGLPRAAIVRRHGCTPGQLAGWARRLAWRRPPPALLVKMLPADRHAAYRRLCQAGLPRAEALRRAAEPAPEVGSGVGPGERP